MSSRGYVPSAWDLPWQERPEINDMYRQDEEKQRMSYDENPTMLEMVQEFHRKHGIKSDPKIENDSVSWLRYELIAEEAHELGDALMAHDRVAVADALGDLLYVVFGAADVYDIDIERVFREVHRSNMTKASDGGQNERIHKILKGPEYSPPDLSFVLEDLHE